MTDCPWTSGPWHWDEADYSPMGNTTLLVGNAPGWDALVLHYGDEISDCLSGADRALIALAPKMAKLALGLVDESGYVTDLMAPSKSDLYDLAQSIAKELRGIIEEHNHE